MKFSIRGIIMLDDVEWKSQNHNQFHCSLKRRTACENSHQQNQMGHTS